MTHASNLHINQLFNFHHQFIKLLFQPEEITKKSLLQFHYHKFPCKTLTKQQRNSNWRNETPGLIGRCNDSQFNKQTNTYTHTPRIYVWHTFFYMAIFLIHYAMQYQQFSNE